MNRYEKHIAQELNISPEVMKKDCWSRFLRLNRKDYAPAKPMKSLREGWRTRGDYDSWVSYCIMDNSEGLTQEEVIDRVWDEYWITNCGCAHDCCGCVSSWNLRAHCVGSLVIVVHHMHRNV